MTKVNIFPNWSGGCGTFPTSCACGKIKTYGGVGNFGADADGEFHSSFSCGTERSPVVFHSGAGGISSPPINGAGGTGVSSGNANAELIKVKEQRERWLTAVKKLKDVIKEIEEIEAEK